MNHDDSSANTVTRPTACRDVEGRAASHAITRKTGSVVASTWPRMITSAIWSVNGSSSQNPSPQNPIVAPSPAPLSAPAATTPTVATSANTNASGIQRSDHVVNAPATRSSPRLGGSSPRGPCG